MNGEVSGFSHVIPYIQCVTNYNYICFHQYLIHFRVELDLDYLIEFVLLMAVKTHVYMLDSHNEPDSTVL